MNFLKSELFGLTVGCLLGERLETCAFKKVMKQDTCANFDTIMALKKEEASKLYTRHCLCVEKRQSSLNQLLPKAY